MSGSLGQLNVSLSAETVNFIRAMDKAAFTAEMRFGQMRRNATIAGLAIGGALVSAAGTFAVKMKQMVDEADKIGKVAQSLGVTVEALSALKYAADLSDVSMLELESAVNRLNKAASSGSQIFDTLGISLKKSDGTLKDANDLIGDIADKFSHYQDGAGKSAAAMELFGRSGAALIPMLNEGRDGLEKMRQEAERFGVIIDTQTAAKAQELNDNIRRLQIAMDGAFLAMMPQVLSVLVSFSEEIVNSAEGMEEMRKAARTLAVSLVDVITAGRMIGETFQTAGRTLGDFAAVQTFIAQGKFKEAMGAMAKSSQDTSAAWEDIFNSQLRMLDIIETKASEQNAVAPIVKHVEKAQLAIRDLEEDSKRIKNTLTDVGGAFSSSFEEAVFSGEKLRDVLAGLEQDILRILFRRGVAEPIANAIFGSATGGAGLLGGLFSAKGNAFSGRNRIFFADGGVVGGPMSFPLAGGRTGVAGEAGPEGIFPLKRTRSGELGVVGSGGGGVEVNIYAPPGSQVSEDRQMDGSTERINIFIDEATANNIRPGTKTFKALRDNFGLGRKLISR